MRRRNVIPLLIIGLLAACDADPTAPGAPASPRLVESASAKVLAGDAYNVATAPPAIQALIEDAFTFLEPLPESITSGAFEPSVLPALAVHVCEVSACNAPPLAAYTSTTGPGSETIRMSTDDETFIVNWKPTDLGLPSPATYRIRVVAAGLALGHADVQLVSTGGELRNAITGETLALLDKQTVPVKFTVRQNPIISAWLLAGEGASAREVAELLVDELGLDASETASILALIGYAIGDVAGVLHDVFGYTAEMALPVLLEIGASAFDIGAALVTEFEQTLEQAASLLKVGGFDAETVFNAVYDMGVKVLGNPVDFALTVAVATMNGLGYAFDDFKSALFGGIHDWTQENLVDALGLSGFTISDIASFMLNVMGVTVDHLMNKAASWGIPLPDLVDALVDAGAAIDEIVAGAIASFDATVDAIGQALADAGASALEIGAAIMDAYDQTIDEVAATLKDLGFAGEVVFNAVYDISVKILDQPVDFALNVAVAVMHGVGFAFDDFKDALFGGIHDWTQENLIDALGLSGFTISDLASFMINVMGLTVERVSKIAESWGVPVQDLIGALVDAGAAMEEIVAWSVAAYDLTAAQLAAAMKAAGQQVADFADAMINVLNLSEEAAIAAVKAAGYLAHETGEWLYTRLAGFGESTLEKTARLLADAGYLFDNVAAWVWTKSGNVADATVKALRFAGYTAKQVTRFLATTAGSAARVIFSALQKAGYGAAVAAEALYTEAGATLVAIGGWLAEFYGLTAEATLEILYGLGASLADLITVLFDVFEATLEEATALLLEFGFTLVDILAAWPG